MKVREIGRRERQLLLLLVTFWCLSPAAVNAASVRTSNHSDLAQLIVVLEGQIIDGDFSRVQTEIEALTRRVAHDQIFLALSSPGGSTSEAMKIARYLRARGVGTLLLGGKQCFSACAFAFLGGYDKAAKTPRRIVFPDARLGVHSVRVDPKKFGAAKFQSSDADAFYRGIQSAIGQMIGFLHDMETTATLQRRVFETDHSKIHVLSKNEMIENSVVLPVRNRGAWRADAPSVRMPLSFSRPAGGKNHLPLATAERAETIPELDSATLFQRCTQRDVEACTQFLSRDGAAPYQLAAAYHSRGLGRLRSSEEPDALDRAISDLTAAIRHRSSAEAYNDRGVSLRTKGDLDSALADFEEAIRLTVTPVAKHALFFINRGRILVQKEEFERAFADFDEAIRLNSLNAQAYFYRGEASESVANFERAAADYQTAALLDRTLIQAVRSRDRVRAALAARQAKGAADAAPINVVPAGPVPAMGHAPSLFAPLQPGFEAPKSSLPNPTPVHSFRFGHDGLPPTARAKTEPLPEKLND